jgi:hypothetical protein
MPTINANRVGNILNSNANFTTARQTAGTVADGTFSVNDAISYQFDSSRGQHRIRRSYIHFDVSSVTGVVSSLTLNLTGNTNTSSDLIVLKSTAFGGDGGTALSSTDYFTNVDFNTKYSAEVTSWSTGTNNITLNSTAESDIQNNDDFVVVLVNHNNDFSNSAAAATTSQNSGLNLSSLSNAQIIFTEGTVASDKNILSIPSGRLILSSGKFTV